MAQAHKKFMAYIHVRECPHPSPADKKFMAYINVRQFPHPSPLPLLARGNLATQAAQGADVAGDSCDMESLLSNKAYKNPLTSVFGQRIIICTNSFDCILDAICEGGKERTKDTFFLRFLHITALASPLYKFFYFNIFSNAIVIQELASKSINKFLHLGKIFPCLTSSESFHQFSASV